MIIKTEWDFYTNASIEAYFNAQKVGAPAIECCYIPNGGLLVNKVSVGENA